MSVPPLVGHLVARDGVPARSGLAYDYVLAGDGLFLAAENHLLHVRVPVARCTVRGLPPVYASCTLTRGRLPVRLWHEMVRVARAVAALGREVLFVVVHDPAAVDPTGAYQLDVPEQVAGPALVAYHPPAPGARVVLELHSHHVMPARFSRTDDADEQRLCLYGVIGRLDHLRPEVALRAGAYGHYLPLPWESVFQDCGEVRAGVHDTHFDGPYHTTVDTGSVAGVDGDDTGRGGCTLAEGALDGGPEPCDDHSDHSDHRNDSNHGDRAECASDAGLPKSNRFGPTPRRLGLWHELRD